jgi:hypothetical protein
MSGALVLADGTMFRGTSDGVATGEVVFNIAMRGLVSDHRPCPAHAAAKETVLSWSRCRHGVACATTIQGGLAVARSLRAGNAAVVAFRPLQSHHETLCRG